MHDAVFIHSKHTHTCTVGTHQRHLSLFLKMALGSPWCRHPPHSMEPPGSGYNMALHLGVNSMAHELQPPSEWQTELVAFVDRACFHLDGWLRASWFKSSTTHHAPCTWKPTRTAEDLDGGLAAQPRSACRACIRTHRTGHFCNEWQFSKEDSSEHNLEAMN